MTDERAGTEWRLHAGAEKLWAGMVDIQPDAKTGPHHHGPLESVIYVVSGQARMRWGERLEFMAEAGPGDFIYVPPFVPHQEINADPEQVHWVDDIHREPWARPTPRAAADG